jgi:two-component system response regulator HydG
MKDVLIIDDVVTLGLMLKTWFSKKGFQARSVISIGDAKKNIQEQKPDLIISDLRLPDGSGLDLIKWVKESYDDIVIIVMTSYADIQTAVECIRSGAYDYIAKPLNPEEVLKKIQALENSKEKISNHVIPSSGNSVQNTGFIRGNSVEYKKVYEYVDLVAPTNLSVFIKGDSGVGKEHIARLIHEKSNRASGPFVPVDCGVMSKELSASDFFGHIRGSFTGAIHDKKGHFVEANKGTLFLDEIGNLSVDTQMQLLRVLQEKKIKPVGANKEIPVDVRVVTATNEDMEKAIASGRFRSDLFHRLNEFMIQIPTLENCKEDISLFAHHFLQMANREMNKNVIGFDEETLALFQSYHWPGNIRELKNVVFRLNLVTQDPIIKADLLKETMPDIYNHKRPDPLKNKDSQEKERIVEALKKTNNNKSKAAELLEIDRKTLYKRMSVYNIEDE